MRTSINKKSDFDFIVLDSEGNAIDMPTSDFTLDLWTWGSKCRFRTSSIGGVLKGCKNDGGKLRVYVDNPGFVPGKLVGEWVSYVSSEEYPDGTQRTCRYISDFGIDMVDGDSTTNEQQVLAMMQYIQGASAYEIACEHGYQGTEEEWLNSLSLESVNAANECRELMAQLSTAEDVRNANEQTRIANEQARVESESGRSYEEDRRADAESARLHNEQVRQTAESIRKDAENYRITHENSRESNETMRQNSETARVAAEESRVAAEESRQTAEQARETAEASRATAEEARERTHSRLKAAMREYADAESLREESEAERREAEQYRIEYEQSRQSSEATRATNERSRTTAESQRVTAETVRSNAESNRATSETARQEAETARQTAEQGRVTAEQQRADAEAARAEEFATFEGQIAAKEDAANKVTSIGADANNTTFPTTRAVLDSIAEVKNIEVTPEMLSESTKQYINASGGGTITNLADDEDLTSVGNVLKLANKDYSPTSYSGMGRIYLRKNMVDSKNILTQEMMTKENTIYIIQYDYDLNGATINVPANCTLDFQGGSLGNGTVVFNATELDGNVKIFSGFYGRLTNSQIHTKWFINLSLSTDCTITLRRIIKLAYDSSLNSSGWRKVTTIHIDRGIYNVSSSLIDSSLNVIAGRFNFIGDGYQNTEIVYSSAEVALFNNQQIFGFTTFKDITFKGTNDSVFANLVGGGGGNSQSFTFAGCSFAVWKTILNSSGSTMNSEVTFDRCKIHSCGAADNLCSLFILNNQQAVNWRFTSTDIESFIGVCFSVLAGCNVSIYQGSIIPYSNDKENPSVFIEVPSNANANSFGSNNSPHFAVNQSRFELRNYTKLLRLLQTYAGLNAVFNEVGLGGSNLATDEDFYTIELVGQKFLTFDNCENFSKYKYIHTGENGADTRAVIKTNNGSMFTQLVKYSKQTTQPTNRWAYCFVENTATGEISTAYSNGTAKGFCLGVNPQEVSYLWSTSPELNTLALFGGKEWSTKLMKPMILTGLSVMHFRSTAYGESVINYRVATLDADGNEVKTILQSSVYMTANKVIEAFIDSATPVYGVKLEITHNIDWLTANLVVRGLVKINYI